MLYRWVRPVRREGARNVHFQQRIPADARALAVGVKLVLPVGNEFVTVANSEATTAITVSLRTADPSEAKARNAKLGAHPEGEWSHLEAGPICTPGRHHLQSYFDAPNRWGV